MPRQVLLQLLRPPPGFQLDRAIGTTFSIDLEAALIAPLAFASFRVAGTSDPIAVMEAVRSAASRIDIFSQAGQMHPPSQASGLFAFLESVVHDVAAPRKGYLFHPKVWFLRYVTADGERCARLLCLTRNLTKDASWDVALRLDGDFGPRNRANAPLRDFLKAIPAMAIHPLAEDRIAAIDELADSAMRVHWEQPADIRSEPTFWPLGHRKGKANELPDFGGYRHLVVAPFLNAGGLQIVAPDKRSDVTVVSRPEDLDRLPSSLIDTLGSTHVVSSAADLDDPDDEALVDRDRLHGLRAKFYVVDSNRAASMFFGSANATDAAFGGKVEILVELRGGATKFGVDQFLRDDTGLRRILEDYEPTGDADPDPMDEVLRNVRAALRSIAAVPFEMTAAPSGDGWTLTVESRRIVLTGGMTATIELLTDRGRATDIVSGTEVDLTLGPVTLDEVSPFLLIRVHALGPAGEDVARATVVRAHLINDPVGRLDEILARPVDTPEKFIRFLLMLLGLSQGALVLGDEPGGEAHGTWSAFGANQGLFELIVRAATDRPEVVDDLHRMIERLRMTKRGRAILPPGFDELWTVIEQAGVGLKAVRAATNHEEGRRVRWHSSPCSDWTPRSGDGVIVGPLQTAVATVGDHGGWGGGTHVRSIGLVLGCRVSSPRVVGGSGRA